MITLACRANLTYQLRNIFRIENILRETTNLCVEKMNSKRQVQCKGKTWSRGTNSHLPLESLEVT